MNQERMRKIRARRKKLAERRARRDKKSKREILPLHEVEGLCIDDGRGGTEGARVTIKETGKYTECIRHSDYMWNFDAALDTLRNYLVEVKRLEDQAREHV